MEGARWHLFTKVFGNAVFFKDDLQSKIILQEHPHDNPNHTSFSWQVLRRATEIFGAKTYVGETGLPTPPFFLNAHRGPNIVWGTLDESPIIVNWSGLDSLEQAEIVPILVSTDNHWIFFMHSLGPE